MRKKDKNNKQIDRSLFAGITMFVRDADLPAEIAEKYTDGLIVREKVFVDASIKFKGMATTHRFIILSNQMADYSFFEHGTNWGLYVAQNDSRFKVLGKITIQDKTAIIMLHLPQRNWKVFLDAKSRMEDRWYKAAVKRFKKTYNEAVDPELASEEWLSRCAFPIGIDNSGNYWPLENKAPWSKLDKYDYCDARYYRLNKYYIIKRTIDGNLYTFNPSDNSWYLDSSLKAEFAWGETYPYTEMTVKDDPFPIVTENIRDYNGLFEARQRKYYHGCMIGGAVGDALGYPVEFYSEEEIRESFGADGIQFLSQAGEKALISDDTQMSLFAANAIIYHVCHEEKSTLGSCLKEAYREWYKTQRSSVGTESEQPRMWVYDDPRMHAARAPGNTCLSSIASFEDNDLIKQADNNSKGCGTVMRAAPFGLMSYSEDDSHISEIRHWAKTDASLTHGHPTAQAASEVLACLIYRLVFIEPFRFNRLEDEIKVIYSDDTALMQMIDNAIKYANDKELSDIDGINMLGEGWVAEEALAIAVFCAVRYQNDFAAAIRAAVNHKGDSDSTGAICGNILGAWLGIDAVSEAFQIQNLELSDVIFAVADDLFSAAKKKMPSKGTDIQWDRKYYLR